MSTPSVPSLAPKRVLQHLLERQAARRQARQDEQLLALAVAGEFGRGVQSDVIAAQARWAAEDSAAA